MFVLGPLNVHSGQRLVKGLGTPCISGSRESLGGSLFFLLSLGFSEGRCAAEGREADCARPREIGLLDEMQKCGLVA